MELNGINETEFKILGMLIMSEKHRDKIFNLLDGYKFEYTNNKIYKAIKELYKDNEHIDNVTVGIYLRNEKQLNPKTNDLLARICLDYMGSAQYEYNCKLLLKHQLNELIKSAKTAEDLGHIQKLNARIDKYESNEAFQHIGVDNDDMNHYYESMDNKILSHYPSLDRITKGFYGGELIFVAAATGAGKTAFALNIVKKIARSGKNVLFISLEMSKREIRKRLNCSDIEIDSAKIRGHELSKDEAEKYFANFEKTVDTLPVYINKKFNISINKIKEYAKQLKDENKLDLIVIDYLTLIRTLDKFNNKREEVTYLTRELKILACEMQVPVICLAQLNRTNADRANKKPVLSDLKESSSIEQDADMVIFLYREDYYDPETTKKGILEVAVAKGRDCGTGTCELLFNKKYQQIKEKLH